MASAKTWYWIGLTVLAISFSTSDAGRCWVDRASQELNRMSLRAKPYAAMVEMAFGRTESGFGHLQSAVAEIQAEQAHAQARQARVQVELVQQQMQELNAELASRRLVLGKPGEPVFVCPRTRVKVAVPQVKVTDISTKTPAVTVVEDPI